MTFHRGFLGLFRFPWRSRAQRAAELDAEMGFHLDMKVEELVRKGVPVEEARRLALAQFGDLLEAKRAIARLDGQAEVRTRLADLGAEFVQDVRYAVRYLRRSPGFTAAVTLTLGIAVAAVTAAFGLIDAYLIRPLPFPEPDRLVYIIPGPDRNFTVAPPASFRQVDWETVDGVFAETVAWDLDGYTLTGGESAEYVDGAWVSAGFLSSLGIRTIAGRVFSRQETETGAPVALISHALWIRRFNRDPGIIGQVLSGFSTDRPDAPLSARIVGVLAPDTWHINRFTDLLLPLTENRLPSMARLRPGMTVREAEARLNQVVSPQVPDADPRWRMTLVSAQDEYVYRVRPVLKSLLGAAVVLLLIAAANTAGLLIASGGKRAGDMAIRSAIGAGKGRLVRQLVTEGIVLAALAGGVGLLGAEVFLSVLDGRIEQHLGIPIPGGADTLGISGSTAAIAILATFAVGLVFTLVPALILSRTRVSALRAGRSTFAGNESRTQGALVVAQVGSTFLLLVGASLIFDTLGRMNQSELGFTAAGVLKAHILIPQGSYPEDHNRIQVMDRALATLAAEPGIEEAALVFPHPFRDGMAGPLLAEGVGSAEENLPRAVHHVASSTYFKTLQIELIDGRSFSALDQAATEPVAILSETLAATLWPDRSALGRRIRIGDSSSTEPWRRVVGIVADVQKTFTGDQVPDTYVPYSQNARGYVALMVRSRTPTAIQPAVQRALASIDPAIPLSEVETMEQVLADRGSRHRFLALLISSLAVFSLFLAAVALYSSLTWLVSRRSREFSIRMALGAGGGQLLRQLGSYGGRRFVLGTTLGIGLSVAMARTMTSLVEGAQMPGVPTYLLVTGVVGLVAVLAFLSPALRVLHTDPGRVLRDD